MSVHPAGLFSFPIYVGFIFVSGCDWSNFGSTVQIRSVQLCTPYDKVPIMCLLVLQFSDQIVEGCEITHWHWSCVVCSVEYFQFLLYVSSQDTIIIHTLHHHSFILFYDLSILQRLIVDYYNIIIMLLLTSYYWSILYLQTSVR